MEGQDGGSDHPNPSYSGGEKDSLEAVKSEKVGFKVRESSLQSRRK
jgi:hypothetical protein